MPALWARHTADEFVKIVGAVAVDPFHQPVITPPGTMPADFQFGTLKLSDPVRRSVYETGYREPTPIQEAATPILLAGRDCVGQAVAFDADLHEASFPRQSTSPTTTTCQWGSGSLDLG